MDHFVSQICTQTRDLINLIDATLLEAVFYARGETTTYATSDAFDRQMIVQAQALRESIAELDALLDRHREFIDAARSPQNVPGQVMAIAEVIADKVQLFHPGIGGRIDMFFRALPETSRHDLMARLRAYRDFVYRAAGVERSESSELGYATDPLPPHWW